MQQTNFLFIETVNVFFHIQTASEFRNWLLFYAIPCVQGILREDFRYHFALLVEGIYILLGDEITQSSLEKAKNMLLEFYRLYPKYYGMCKTASWDAFTLLGLQE